MWEMINLSALVVYHGYKCSLIIRYSIRYGCIGILHRLEFKPNKRINMLCFLLTEFFLCFVHQRSKRSHTIDINSEIVDYLVRYQLIDKRTKMVFEETSARKANASYYCGAAGRGICFACGLLTFTCWQSFFG
jgi:hypothetical protein